ncbi:MAG: endolytic transglycosylase MltG, partial [Pseudomonadota bacterium]
MARSLASNALTLLIPVLVIVAGVLYWGQTEYRGPGPLAEAMCVQVPSGSTVQALSERLVEEGAIRNASIFRLGADYSELSDDLKAGSFVVQPGASMEEILVAVTSSGRSTCGTEVNYRIGVTSADVVIRDLDPQTQRYTEIARFAPSEDAAPDAYARVKQATGTRYRVTLAEGVTSWQVLESLKALDILEGEVAELPPEGSLAPDSYEVRPGTARSELVASMASRQDTILSDLWATRAPDLPIETPDEALILASIVEKETALAEERP